MSSSSEILLLEYFNTKSIALIGYPESCFFLEKSSSFSIVGNFRVGRPINRLNGLKSS